MCLSCTNLQNDRTEYLSRITIFLFSCILFISFFGVNATFAENFNKDEQIEKLNAQTVEVILQRHYLDGEISEESVQETIWSMEDFWAFYEEWQLVDQNEERIIFKQDFNDISPLLKMNGYFGLSEDGTLNIYNGNPNENDVIQSFFQVNTSRLKSHLHQELMEGIPVATKDQYLQVLKMCEKYAINEL
ncbi:intercompartmental signaling factor BofC [Evansella sp. AB-P1]|uniref:intercompartmental signaling factor BofC n=1 Tax=Evansella sp. AB-P1 TaxID=3037653 RepID=UPI00241BFA16|nr:intercompartmental signaling factor BofC [Evansella sp. AB-P1]MDG5786430.1 intercompartmental signaling factor BofC [Evansella sp. AB-P1]